MLSVERLFDVVFDFACGGGGEGHDGHVRKLFLEEAELGVIVSPVVTPTGNTVFRTCVLLYVYV